MEENTKHTLKKTQTRTSGMTAAAQKAKEPKATNPVFSRLVFFFAVRL